VAAGSYGGRVAIWDLAGNEVLAFKANDRNLAALAFSPDGKTLATGGLGDEIALWSLPSGERTGTLAGHKAAVLHLSFLGEGGQLVSMGHEGDIRFWDTSTWETTRLLEGAAEGVRGLTFSPGEAQVALPLESKVQLRSVDDWALQEELPIETKVVSSVAYSPDGRQLAVGAADRKIRVWER
jgi:WD40 repeat protein